MHSKFFSIKGQPSSCKVYFADEVFEMRKIDSYFFIGQVIERNKAILRWDL